MQSIREILNNLCNFYRSNLGKLEKRKLPDIEGHLIIDHSCGVSRFYHGFVEKDKKARKKKYLPKSNMNKIKLLAQKSYDRRFYRLASERLRLLEAALKDFDDFELEKLFSNLAPDRQALVTPLIKPWAQFEKEWLEETSNFAISISPRTDIYSKKGDRVRSKTEKILADMFFDQNISYKYEAPLALGNSIVYPDFTFISPYTRTEIYWEHNGMMGDENYADKTLRKILLYAQNNIHLGKNLILTFESKNIPFNFALAQVYIDQYLKI